MVLSRRYLRRTLLAGSFIAMAAVIGAYVITMGKLSAARQARRDDQCAVADRGLAACWRLPGLAREIALEEQLLAVQQGDLSDEERWHSRAAGHSAESGPILEALAKGNLATFQWEAAQKYAESILHRSPQDARAFWLRGRALVQMQHEDQARRDFERAVELEPTAFEVRRSLADLLHALGHVRAAIEQYQRQRVQRPDDERVTLALAHCWQEEAQLDKARALVDALLVEYPNAVAGLVERGRLALRSGDPPSAERWLRQAVALRPDDLKATFVLGLSLQAQHKEDAALQGRIKENNRREAELKLRLHKSRDDPELLTDVGQWMVRTGRDDEAAGWFYAALKEESGYAAAHVGLAEVFSQNGQMHRAAWHARRGGSELKLDQQRSDSSPASEQAAAALSDSEPLTEAIPEREATSEEVHRLCAACHAYPPPESMPRSAWREEVKQGFDFLRDSALAGDFPPLESIVRYYELRAPERLPSIDQPAAAATAPIKFEKRGTGWVPNLPRNPAVANANLVQLFGGGTQELVLCDTRLDALLLLKPYESNPGGAVLPQVTAPCHSAVCDLDRDGRQDLLVASLGSFFPTDDRVGKVYWLQGQADGRFEAVQILDGVGRVSDVQVADFNADGLLDLIVAVFGWRNGGEILYLENRTDDWSEPRFASRVVDRRNGAIHVPVADLNHDGRPDFVALISQQHETVVAYLNQGDGVFQTSTIFTAPHPSYGSSGIELVDFDGDRDLDVLLTNGDILDRPYVLKPYHGVQWLENEGTFPFKHHAIAAMHGASRAVAADFDGDGDQDVAAVSFLPAILFPERERMRLPSVVLFEQSANQQFLTHVLERGTCDHLSCAVGDWDDDGRVDLAVGNFSWSGSQEMDDAAVLWRNAGRP